LNVNGLGDTKLLGNLASDAFGEVQIVRNLLCVRILIDADAFAGDCALKSSLRLNVAKIDCLSS
jgi:hypothetical protein